MAVFIIITVLVLVSVAALGSALRKEYELEEQIYETKRKWEDKE